MEEETDFRVARDLKEQGFSQDRDGQWSRQEENGSFTSVEVDGRHTRTGGTQSWDTHY